MRQPWGDHGGVEDRANLLQAVLRRTGKPITRWYWAIRVDSVRSVLIRVLRGVQEGGERPTA